jgi:hypothetical protein
MKNGAISGAVQVVSSPRSGDYHVMVAESELPTGVSVHIGCEAMYATERAASNTAVCRACWTYLWHSQNNMGLDFSRSLAILRTSGAYVRGMYACHSGQG